MDRMRARWSWRERAPAGSKVPELAAATSVAGSKADRSEEKGAASSAPPWLEKMFEVPAELLVAGSRTTSPKTRESELVSHFLGGAEQALSVQLGDLGQTKPSTAERPKLSDEYDH
uniref:Uncharacterized protein n=1 Tax=Oryza meridionalis TaxID=40149 RepID=A0A0E0FDR6_9ORYZ